MKALRWLDENFEKVILSILIAAIVLVMLLQIIMRYVFNNSLPWTEEFCRYCYIYFMFIGTALVVKNRSALRVDAIVQMLPEKVQKILDILIDICVLALCVRLFIGSIAMVRQLYSTGAYSAGLHLPTWIVNLAAPIGLFLTALRYVQSLIQLFVHPKKEGGESC